MVEPVTIAFLIGAGIFLLGAMTTGWTLHRRVKALEEKMKGISYAFNATVSVNEELISISDLRGNTLDDTISAIHDIKQVQRIFQFYINKLLSDTKLLERQSFDNLLAINLVQQLELSQKAREVTNALRQHIQQHAIGITSLKNGHLPSQLISYASLRSVLYDIQKELPHDVQLGIPVSDITRYYTEQLASFSQDKGQTQIHLAIPLSLKLMPSLTQLYRPVYHIFPIPQVWAAQANVSSDEFLQLDLPREYWVFDGRVFMGTIRHDDLTSCQSRGSYKACTSYNAHLQHREDDCRLQLMYRDLSSISRSCDFTIPKRMTYKPVHVENGTYVVHYRRDFDFSVVCGRRDTETPVLIHERWDTVDVPEGCLLTVVADKGHGSLSGGEYTHTSTSHLKLHTSADPTSVFGISIHARNKTKRSPEVLDVVTPASIVRNNLMIQESHQRIRRQLEDVKTVANGLSDATATRPFSFWNTVELFTRTVFDLIALLTLFVMIGSGRWQFLMSSSVVVVSPADAVEFSLNPLDYLPSPADAFSLTGISHLLTLLKIIIIVVLLFLAFSRSLLHCVKISYHTGLINRTASRFFLELAIVVTTKSFRVTNKQLITIRVPLQRQPPPETATVISLKETNFFHISRGGLLLAEPLTIRGLFADGTYSFTGDLRVRIPWTDITWEGKVSPKGLRYGSHGTAFVRVIPDPRRI